MTDQPTSLAAALAELQTKLPHIGKDADAQYGKYADLAAITKTLMPILGKLGLSFTAAPTLDIDGKFVLRYGLGHVNGGSIEGKYPLPGMEKGPQALGSAITYARRYCLLAVTGVAPDDSSDDDGEAAEEAEGSGSGGRWMNRRPDVPPAHLRDQLTPGPRPGPELEQLRDGTIEPTPDDRPAKRSRVPAGRDPWQDAEPGQLPPNELAPEESPGSLDGRQRSQIMAKLGCLPREDRLARLTEITGREVDSANQLSHVEAALVIRTLDADAKAAAEVTP